MSDLTIPDDPHLPECFLVKTCFAPGPHQLIGIKDDWCWKCHRTCICSALRACEQRGFMLGWGEGHHIGYGHAIDAAEAAVREVYRFGDYGEHFVPSEPERVAIHLEEALAAIDDLKGKP